ncbi:hypothetical protein KQY30_09740 [Streptomyces sp. GMY02]|uniref:hypothetical protein n=1 Tax=Streptomyces sp. GMY02 TaxID=1333528 RepID=UPI001C2BB116|nr:hypothetical protein [Streptomyces sp. GMY02]QXE34524.1 hypothetical protein KQY30_09740 [Streptomyces sp. GMY02]
MNPTPETKTPEPETAEASTTEATEVISDSRSESEAPSLSKAGAPAADATDESADTEDVHDLDDDEDLDEDGDDDPAAHRSSGLGAAAAAVVAVCLSIIALSGTWTGRVVAERETLVGQITIGQSATADQQISEIYGDAWHATAAVNGVVALLALLIGVVVLVLPQRVAWVRPFALAAAILGFLGLLVSAGMYFDLFAALPAAPATPAG